MRKTTTWILAGCALAAAPAAAQEATPWREAVDIAAMQPWTLHMRMMKGDEVDGFWWYGWRRDGDVIRAFDRTMMESSEIYEAMEGVYDAATLDMQSLDISFHRGADQFRFTAAPEEGRVVGEAVARKWGAADEVHPIDVETGPEAAARSVAFVIAPALPMEIGRAYAFQWVNVMAPAPVADVTLTVAGTETVETPAGTFETYKVELRGAQPENDIYVTVEEPRRIVRLDVAGRDLRFEALPGSGAP